MSRDEEASLNARAEEAEKRLFRGIESSKAIVAQYRRRLLMLRDALQRASEHRHRIPAKPQGPR